MKPAMAAREINKSRKKGGKVSQGHKQIGFNSLNPVGTKLVTNISASNPKEKLIHVNFVLELHKANGSFTF